MAQGFDNIWNMAKTAGKTGLEYAPYVGDIYDIARGGYQAFHGHPFLGTGQAVLGGAGLAANLLFPGTGSVAKAGVKAGIKTGAKTIAKKTAKNVAQEAVNPNKIQQAMQDYAKFNRSLKGQLGTAIIPEIGYNIMDASNNISGDSIAPLESITQDISERKSPTNRYSSEQVAQQIANELNKQSQYREEQQPNTQYINDYIQQLKDINQPYVNALKDYVDNYNKMFTRQQKYSRRLRDISAITGDPTWYQSAKDFNPVIQEANRVNAIKQLQDAQAGDINAINEVMGNLALAQEMGLPPEAAFANKNLLTMMAAKDREDNKLRIALENNLMKKYGIDRNYARALAVQGLRNQGALDVANLNAQAYGFGGLQPQQNQAQPIRNIQR